MNLQRVLIWVLFGLFFMQAYNLNNLTKATNNNSEAIKKLAEIKVKD